MAGGAGEEVEEEVLGEPASAEGHGHGEGDGGVGFDGVAEGGGELGFVGVGEAWQEAAAEDRGGGAGERFAARFGEEAQPMEAGAEEKLFGVAVDAPSHACGAEEGAGRGRQGADGVDDVFDDELACGMARTGRDLGQDGEAVGRDADEVCGVVDVPEAAGGEAENVRKVEVGVLQGVEIGGVGPATDEGGLGIEGEAFGDVGVEVEGEGERVGGCGGELHGGWLGVVRALRGWWAGGRGRPTAGHQEWGGRGARARFLASWEGGMGELLDCGWFAEEWSRERAKGRGGAVRLTAQGRSKK